MFACTRHTSGKTAVAVSYSEDMDEALLAAGCSCSLGVKLTKGVCFAMSVLKSISNQKL